MAYSVALRDQVLNYIKAWHNRSEACKVFGVSLRTIVRWLSMNRAGSISDPKPRRPWKKIDPKALMIAVEQNSGYKLSDFARVFKVSTSAICLAFKTLKITRKKRPLSIEKETKKNERYFWQRSPSIQKKS